MELAFFDLIVRLFPKWAGFDVKVRHAELLKKMMTEEIEIHRKNLVPGEPKASGDLFFIPSQTLSHSLSFSLSLTLSFTLSLSLISTKSIEFISFSMKIQKNSQEVFQKLQEASTNTSDN